jgi:hypothetical protein
MSCLGPGTPNNLHGEADKGWTIAHTCIMEIYQDLTCFEYKLVWASHSIYVYIYIYTKPSNSKLG